MGKSCRKAQVLRVTGNLKRASKKVTSSLSLEAFKHRLLLPCWGCCRKDSFIRCTRTRVP